MFQKEHYITADGDCPACPGHLTSRFCTLCGGHLHVEKYRVRGTISLLWLCPECHGDLFRPLEGQDDR